MTTMSLDAAANSVARLSLACLFVAGVSGCAARPRPEVAPAWPLAHLVGIEMIGELKDFAEALGGQATENFLRRSDRLTADNRCYFTGKLQLPEFYSTLRMVREDEAGCVGRSGEYDVFFYPVQAVASGEETVTVSLAEAPAERLLVVVPHEDFHSQPEKVSALYREFRSGAITQAETLEQKAGLFADLQRECAEILPDPVSFNKCPAAINNAGLAFDRTYTRNYPMLHDLYRLLGSDTATLVPTLKRLLGNWPVSAARAADLLKAE
jgi:hypothetical protein